MHGIEYDGFWIDQEELLNVLSEPDGKFNFQSRWEENHSLYHLWIRGDRSFINMYIQKWHGKPGGDKLSLV